MSDEQQPKDEETSWVKFPRQPDGMDPLLIRGKLYGRHRLVRWEDISHLAEGSDAKRVLCGLYIPQDPRTMDATASGELNCINCCRLALKRSMRLQ